MDRISCEACISMYQIEKHFIDHLADSGIVTYHYEHSVQYINHESLPIIERYARMHYDLNVNLEGIEVIHHLLEKIAKLEAEKLSLKQSIAF